MGSSGTEVAEGCKPLCGCWELNLGAVEEHPFFLTTESLSFQLLWIAYF